MVFGKKFLELEKNIGKKVPKKLLKMLISAFFEDIFFENSAFTKNKLCSRCDFVFYTLEILCYLFSLKVRP